MRAPRSEAALRTVARYGALACMLAFAAPERAAAEAPASAAPLYEVPEPGSYELPPIRRVSDHELVGPEGRRERLLPAAGPELIVIAFVYTHCSEALGCPAALATLRRLDRMLSLRPELAPRVRLVTVSFDPERDTPERMAQLRDQLEPRTEWRFLTPSGAPELGALLRDFRQGVLQEFTEAGRATGVLRHVLQIFLVDAEHAVRNVYSSGLLDPELLLADIQTVLLERKTPRR